MKKIFEQSQANTAYTAAKILEAALKSRKPGITEKPRSKTPATQIKEVMLANT